MQNGFSNDGDVDQSVSPVYKEVVIVGNGPSAITLSYLLTGYWPYYSGSEHSIEFLHYRLLEKKELSLVEQDLEYLCEGLEGRSTNPVSVLFDLLHHPDADLGLQVPSLLHWDHHADKAIDHIVIGRGKPGGSWQGMEGSILTISLGNWMELPNLSYKEWESLQNNEGQMTSFMKQNRATVRNVAQYYNDYVHLQKLSDNFQNKAEVTRVSRFPDSTQVMWQVEGFQQLQDGRKNPFTYITPHVVLATGTNDLPNRLDVCGENLPFVIHSLSQLEWLICAKIIGPSSEPLLIVGAGLSAADAIISAHFYGVPMYHAFRRNVTDRSLIFNKLPENMYPEYHKVHQMMQEKGVGYEGYLPLPSHQVVKIGADRKVTLQGPKNTMNVCVSYVVVLIGSHPDLSFLKDDGRPLALKPELPINCRDNTILIDVMTHETVAAPGMYAVGPLVGDNFVRFVQGGALAIVNHLNKKAQKGEDDEII